MTLKNDENLKRNWLAVSKLTQKIWWILTWALKSLKNLYFNGLLLIKVYNVWAKKIQRGYLSWHWRVMPNLKNNWIVLPKMTWRILQIFTRALQDMEIGTFMRSFYPKQKMYELKIYTGDMCHGNVEWCKIWKGIDSSI